MKKYIKPIFEIENMLVDDIMTRSFSVGGNDEKVDYEKKWNDGFWNKQI